MKIKNRVMVISGIMVILIFLVMISGCTSGDYSVEFQNATVLESFNDAEAMDSVIPKESDAGMYEVTDYGTKIVEGVTVYYNKYTVLSDNSVEGAVYFQKNGKWYYILWHDVEGNPNNQAIENDVANKIKSV